MKILEKKCPVMMKATLFEYWYSRPTKEQNNHSILISEGVGSDVRLSNRRRRSS
jgi:hypothetical protein